MSVYAKDRPAWVREALDSVRFGAPVRMANGER